VGLVSEDRREKNWQEKGKGGTPSGGHLSPVACRDPCDLGLRAARRCHTPRLAVPGTHSVRSSCLWNRWQNFTRQLRVHRTVEDDCLWPRLKKLVAGRPEALALSADMEAEHAVLDPRLDAVDVAVRAARPNSPDSADHRRHGAG